MIYVLAIGNKARQGKTTISILLNSGFKDLGAYSTVLSFADSLKSFYRIENADYALKNKGPLQQYSDDLKEDFGKDCFAKDLIARIKDDYKGHEVLLEDPDVIYIVPDLRYRRELELLRDAFQNVITVQVKRLDWESDDNRDPNHPSEIDFDGVEDWADYNVSAKNIEELKECAGLIVTDLLGIGSEQEELNG